MVIENADYLSSFVQGRSIFVEVITSNDKFHPRLSSPVAITVGYENNLIIVPIDHPEGINLQTTQVQQILTQAEKVLTPNKKELLYFFKHPDIVDLNLVGIKNNLENLEIPVITYFYRNFGEHPEVNKLIPLLKLYQRHHKAYEEIYQSLQDLQVPEDLEFINNIAIPVYYLLERQGLRIEYDSFVELYKPLNPVFNIKDEITYTSYNPYNITTRPTNAFNSVNFAAIPKKEEYRKCFKPQNDTFVEFDFDGYHLRLLADQIGYTFNQEPAHRQLASLYYDRQDITEEEYSQAKQLNFQALYGHLTPEQKDLVFFKRLEKYTEDLWGNFIEHGYVNAPISLKRFTHQALPDMNPKKLLNYIIQSLETSRNVSVIRELLRYLTRKNSAVALYTYDSILIDFNKQDGKQTLIDIQNILSENGKYPVKFKFGMDLNF